MVKREQISDIDFTVRFKHGIHTILLFVDPTSTFKEISEELLDVLQERYPKGLSVALSKSKNPLPSDASLIQFAALKNTTDVTEGWKPLNARPNDTPTAKGVKDGTILAFAFRDEDSGELGEVQFEAEFPAYDETNEGETLDAMEQDDEEE